MQNTSTNGDNGKNVIAKSTVVYFLLIISSFAITIVSMFNIGKLAVDYDKLEALINVNSEKLHSISNEIEEQKLKLASHTSIIETKTPLLNEIKDLEAKKALLQKQNNDLSETNASYTTQISESAGILSSINKEISAKNKKRRI